MRGMMSRRAIVGVVGTVALLALLPTVTAAAAAPAGVRLHLPDDQQTLGRPRVVDVRGLVPTRRDLSGALTPPPPCCYSIGLQADFTGAAPSAAAAPDPSMAASPADVVELAAGGLQIYSRTGAPVSAVSLASVFGTSGFAETTDSQVVFDTQASRWYASVLACTSCASDSGPSEVVLAASHSSDPNGVWNTWVIASDAAAVLEQPRLGFSGNKVVVDYDRFTGGHSFDADYMHVIQKSDLNTAAPPRDTSFNMTSGLNHRFAIRPAVPNAAETTSVAYAAYLGTDALGSYASTLTITGTPAASNVTISEQGPGIDALHTPPLAHQPGSQNIATGDNRFQSVSFVKNGLWIAANDACTFDAAEVCVRLIHVASLSSTAVADQDWDPPLQGDDYDPALLTDCTGHKLLFTYTSSSATGFPTAWIAEWNNPNGKGVTSFGNRIAYATGASALQAGSSSVFGGYSSIASDGTTCSPSVWSEAEFGGVGATGAPGLDIAQVTISRPTVTSVKPVAGTTGDTVAVTGAGFTPDALVLFDGQPVTTPTTFKDSAHLVVTAPFHAPAQVHVQVSTPLGLSPPTAADLFTYAAMAWVSDSTANAVSVVNTATRKRLAPNIHVPDGPDGIRVTSDGTTVWVANAAQNRVTPIDALARLAKASLPGGQQPRDVAVTPDGKFLYVPDFSTNKVRVVDTTTSTVVTSIPVATGPVRVAMSRDGSFVLVTSNAANLVTRISTATNTVVAAIPVFSPWAVAIAPNDETGYVTSLGHLMRVVDLVTNTAAGSTDVGTDPEGIAITPDGSTLFVANTGDNTVTPINTTGPIAGPAIHLAAGAAPKGLAVTPDGTTLFVAESGPGALVPIDVASHSIGAPIAAGAGASSVDISAPIADPCDGSLIKPTLFFDPATVAHDAPLTYLLDIRYCPQAGSGPITVTFDTTFATTDAPRQAAPDCEWVEDFTGTFQVTIQPGDNPEPIWSVAPPACSGAGVWAFNVDVASSGQDYTTTGSFVAT